MKDGCILLPQPDFRIRKLSKITHRALILDTLAAISGERTFIKMMASPAHFLRAYYPKMEST